MAHIENLGGHMPPVPTPMNRHATVTGRDHSTFVTGRDRSIHCKKFWVTLTIFWSLQLYTLQRQMYKTRRRNNKFHQKS